MTQGLSPVDVVTVRRGVYLIIIGCARCHPELRRPCASNFITDHPTHSLYRRLQPIVCEDQVLEQEAYAEKCEFKDVSVLAAGKCVATSDRDKCTSVNDWLSETLWPIGEELDMRRHGTGVEAR